MKIVLVGYMASGKTTIGKLLATYLKSKFIDLDVVIEQTEKQSISEIFSSKGEIYFRRTEAEILKKTLQQKGAYVLSLGGGTPCYGNNMKQVQNIADACVYLQLPVPELVNRAIKEKENRPVIAAIADKDLPEFIGKHLFERRQFYAKANYTIDCMGKSSTEITEEIVKLLQ